MEIKDLYENLTYFDQYSGSFIFCLFTLFILFIICSFCFVMTHSQPIKDDWANQRCKPYVIPVAGFINKPDNMTIGEFTAQNFTFCTQRILHVGSEEALTPINYVFTMMSSVLAAIQESINAIREISSKIRAQLANISKDILSRLSNVIVPLQKVVLSMMDAIRKLQGILTAGLYTSLGSYFIAKSLIEVIIKIVVTVIIMLIAVALASAFWFPPIAMACYAAVATLATLTMVTVVIGQTYFDVNFVKPKLKCFDKDTILEMNDGTKKRIIDIQVGDILKNQNIVTAKMKVETKGSKIYNLFDVVVSDTHMVFYKGKWIKTCQHPYAKPVYQYEEPFLYCLNTSEKVIEINGITFADWDDLCGDSLSEFKAKTGILQNGDIHKLNERGYKRGHKIQLVYGRKNVEDIVIGDVLKHGGYVYGLVQMNYDHFHLLTETGFITSRIRDYNGIIDSLI
jgi:hypothetical protein